MGDEYYPDRRFYGPPPDGPAPPSPPKPKPKPKKQAPQDTIKQFWEKFNSKYPGKVFTVLPDNALARKKAAKTPKGAVQGVRAAKSYEQAKAECERDVDRIIRECRRTNQKYRDPHFDIEWDLKSGMRDCIDSLSGDSSFMKPRGVKRVTDIFEKPQFYIDDPTAGDVRQGRDGDCYLMAALCGLGNMKGLIEKVCIKHDDLCQMCGVYGFVFFRDGEWQTTIIDDKLYLRVPDYDEAVGLEERLVWDDVNRKDSEEEYRKTHQTGSRALYFANCNEENETWLPLLEKAFAKAHGDYYAIDGGFTGEALEDLTGGVTSEFYSTDILDKEAFWRDELMEVNKEFLFGCATGSYSNWLDNNPNAPPRERQGIFEGHAYTIMEAREVEGHRLLKLRNPWGKKEWQGKWSDGSAEWNAKFFELLNHKFGNDGIFWISYEDMLKKYQHFDRTRIFNESWHVTQKWTSLHIPWMVDYHSTKFRLTLKEKSPVVIVLSQLDATYFKGLQGSYDFELQFRIEHEDDEDNDYIVRSHATYVMRRSVSTDIELDAGTYSIFMKITAVPNGNEDLEEMLPEHAKARREKLAQMGMSYDLAHAKGIFIESEKEKEERLRKVKAKKAKDREKERERLRAQALKMWQRRKMQNEREKRANKKMQKANEGRRAQGRAMSRDGYGTDNIGSTNAARGGSLNGTTDEKNKNDGSNKIEGNKTNMPLRLKSFSGELIVTQTQDIASADSAPQASQDAEQDSVTAAVATTLEEGTDSTNSVGAARTPGASPEIVQPLDAVIAEAEAHTASTHTEEKPPTPIVKVNDVDAVTDVRPLPTQPGLSSLDALDDIPALAGGNDGSTCDSTDQNHNKDVAQTESSTAIADKADAGASTELQKEEKEADNENEDDENSSIDSFPSFDWCTELDMSSEEDSENPNSAANNQKPSDPPLLDLNKEDLDIGDLEPWNAVCVVGLRVYSQLEGDGVVLEVVRPGDEEDGEEIAKEKVGLDRDDPSKSLVEVEGDGEIEKTQAE